MKKMSFSIILLVLILSLLLTACGNSNEKASPSGSSASPSPSTSSSPEVIDPLGKYPETVTVTQVLGVKTPEDKNTPQGLKPEENGYLKQLKEMTNIEVKYLWTTPAEQFDQKFSISIASGDLPDVMWVNQKTYEQFKEDGILADLSDAYQKYASTLIKGMVESDGGIVLDMFKEDGELLGIPSFSDTTNSLQTLWIRSDWLKNLNLEVPTTMEELEKVAEAFVKNDPDQNNQDDTYGLALQKNLNFGSFDARGFFYSMGAYPYNFIKGPDGNLIAGETQSETKTALEKLADWYKRGILDKEWAFKDEDKVVEDIVGGKVGISFGEWWYPNWPLNLNREKDPNADWINIPLPSYEGNPGKTLKPRVRLNKILVVKKGFAHPEAAIKMANFYHEFRKDEYKDINTAANGFVYNWYEPRISNSKEMEETYLEVNAAIKENRDVQIINSDVVPSYEAAKKYLSGDLSGWGLYFAKVAEDGGFGVNRKIRDQKLYVVNEFAGPPTQTQVEKGASLTKLTDETFTKIIMGTASIDEYDKFIESWRKLGGDDIVKEVNEWYAKNPSQ